MNVRTTVLLVDDHSVVRAGYRRLLEVSGGITVVGEAACATEAYHTFCSLMPDVVVMDIAMPGVSGIEALRRILTYEPKARVLMFSMYEDAIFARRALEAGAAGYLTKAAAPRVLVDAVATIACGRRFLSPDVAQTLALQPLKTAQAAHDLLSAREFEVLKLFADGLAPNEIAQQLGLNPKTVSNHQSSIRQKLGVETGAQLLRSAIRLGLIPPF
jgi:two-component system, NarL family, invasion response regulator UvrY